MSTRCLIPDLALHGTEAERQEGTQIEIRCMALAPMAFPGHEHTSTVVVLTGFHVFVIKISDAAPESLVDGSEGVAVDVTTYPVSLPSPPLGMCFLPLPPAPLPRGVLIVQGGSVSLSLSESPMLLPTEAVTEADYTVDSDGEADAVSTEREGEDPSVLMQRLVSHLNNERREREKDTVPPDASVAEAALRVEERTLPLVRGVVNSYISALETQQTMAHNIVTATSALRARQAAYEETQSRVRDKVLKAIRQSASISSRASLVREGMSSTPENVNDIRKMASYIKDHVLPRLTSQVQQCDTHLAVLHNERVMRAAGVSDDEGEGEGEGERSQASRSREAERERSIVSSDTRDVLAQLQGMEREFTTLRALAPEDKRAPLVTPPESETPKTYMSLASRVFAMPITLNQSPRSTDGERETGETGAEAEAPGTPLGQDLFGLDSWSRPTRLSRDLEDSEEHSDGEEREEKRGWETSRIGGLLSRSAVYTADIDETYSVPSLLGTPRNLL
ncbi:hypothetical protein KIPB_008107 [Kipferlia bialata]|uniref:Uncharacterized protein n=1 Tax=Kipferlia bialata TaxID=797122 RepID=A0A9K3D022_9EUKA|nr:hypothetical protein KIPB_008107 [Kipferlia bialata]|eukprot:g8107.t1